MLITTPSVATPLVPLSGLLCPFCLHSKMAQAEHHPRGQAQSGERHVRPCQCFPGISGTLYSQGHICLLNFALTEVSTLTYCSAPHPTSLPAAVSPLEFRAAPTPTLEHH